jgi:transmembrane sensor
MRRERDELLDTPLAQAAAWMAIRRSGDMTELQAREFSAWLEVDPAHRAAFNELLLIWDEAGEIREDPTILALRERNLRTFNAPARMRFAAGAMAASIAAIVFGGWSLFGDLPVAPSPATRGIEEPRQDEEQVLRTGVGQTTTAVLRDGSTVILDSDTLLLTRETRDRRSIHLERGGAYFQVAKDPRRPFVVEAAGKTITALGTAFEARVNAGKLDVTLVEGKVKVAAKKGQVWQGQQTMDMTAGWRLTAPDEKKWSLAKVDTKKELSWLSGRMSFFNDPLVEAVAKVNRYSDKQIIVDPSIAQEPIVGVFESGDTDRFVRGMELAGIARVGRVTDTTVELVAP